MTDAPAASVPSTPDRITVPIRRGENMGSLSMTLRDARELRDWLVARVRDEAFGGSEEQAA